MSFLSTIDNFVTEQSINLVSAYHKYTGGDKHGCARALVWTTPIVVTGAELKSGQYIGAAIIIGAFQIIPTHATSALLKYFESRTDRLSGIIAYNMQEGFRSMGYVTAAGAVVAAGALHNYPELATELTLIVGSASAADFCLSTKTTREIPGVASTSYRLTEQF